MKKILLISAITCSAALALTGCKFGENDSSATSNDVSSTSSMQSSTQTDQNTNGAQVAPVVTRSGNDTINQNTVTIPQNNTDNQVNNGENDIVNNQSLDTNGTQNQTTSQTTLTGTTPVTASKTTVSHSGVAGKDYPKPAALSVTGVPASAVTNGNPADLSAVGVPASKHETPEETVFPRLARTEPNPPPTPEELSEYASSSNGATPVEATTK